MSAQQKREELLAKYIAAVESGDMEKVSSILEESLADPDYGAEFDEMIREAGSRMYEEAVARGELPPMTEADYAEARRIVREAIEKARASFSESAEQHRIALDTPANRMSGAEVEITFDNGEKMNLGCDRAPEGCGKFENALEYPDRETRRRESIENLTREASITFPVQVSSIMRLQHAIFNREPIAPEDCKRCQQYNRERDQFKVYQYAAHQMYMEADLPIWIDVAEGYEIAFRMQAIRGNYLSFFLYGGSQKEDEKFAGMLLSHELTPEHLDHVPYSPGLMITMELTRRDNGEKELVQHLVDGNHRAASAIKKNVPPIYYVLNVDETRGLMYSKASEIVAKYSTEIETGNARGVRVVIAESDEALVDLLVRENHRPHHYDFREFERANGMPEGSLGEQEEPLDHEPLDLEAERQRWREIAVDEQTGVPFYPEGEEKLIEAEGLGDVFEVEREINSAGEEQG